MDQSGSDQELPRYTPDDPRIIGDFLCKTLIYNTETNLVASLYVDAPQVAVKSRHHDTSLYASLTTNTNPSRPPFRRRLNLSLKYRLILSIDRPRQIACTCFHLPLGESEQPATVMARAFVCTETEADETSPAIGVLHQDLYPGCAHVLTSCLPANRR